MVRPFLQRLSRAIVVGTAVLVILQLGGLPQLTPERPDGSDECRPLCDDEPAGQSCPPLCPTCTCGHGGIVAAPPSSSSVLILPPTGRLDEAPVTTLSPGDPQSSIFRPPRG